jgi:16S rRNA (uracil1498-N3)-methyltransferase
VDCAGAEEGGLNVRRLFAAALPVQGEHVDLDPEALAHARVLRLQPGDEIELFDGQGRLVRARVVQLDKRAGCVTAVDAVRSVPRGRRVVLVQCQPKGHKLDDIVRMTTELGVSAVHIAVSDRCVARSSSERGEPKAERLRRVAREAARQSEQAYVPEILPPAPLEQVLARAPHEAYRAAFVERTDKTLPANISAPELWLVVGPEGGFSPRDRALLSRYGYANAALGRAILRTETAAVVGVALGLERLGRRD